MMDLLAKRGWSIPRLAAEMGRADDQAFVDRLYKYVPKEDNSHVQNPRGAVLSEIAEALGVTEPILRSGDLANGYRPLPELLGERDLKVFAAVEGGSGEMVVSTDPIELVPRPWYMREVRDGYAVLVVGDSMFPTFEPGDMAIVNPRLPPMRGKDVILIGGEQEGEFRASIKRLEGWTSSQWHLRQFNPPRGQKHEFSWLKRDWPKALRVVGKYYGG